MANVVSRWKTPPDAGDGDRSAMRTVSALPPLVDV